MNKKFLVTMTFGVFYVEYENNNGIKVSSIEGYPLLPFPKVAWWDMDNIIKSLEDNKEKLLERYEFHKKIHS